MLGNRIQRARKAQGFSLRNLADLVALSHAAIKKYEDNLVVPSSDILLKLAKALKVKVEYFFRPERFTLENLQYRKHADMPEKQLEEIKARMLDQIERRVELESLFPSSPIQKFALGEKKIKSYNDIDNIANQVRKQWHLGLDPLLDLIDIFEEHGIKVFEIDNQEYPGFDGLSASINNMPIIVIGNRWPGDRQRFTLAHELAHLVLYGFMHPDLDEEKCCNRFAGAFLLPKEALISILGQHRNYIEPRELGLLKQEFGISMLSILHRIEDAGIISNALYFKLRKELNEKGWAKSEPGPQYPKEITHIFEQMVFHALAEEYIGESKAAELMNMPLESFRSLRAMENQDVTGY
ncbi:MAG: XRE family transcriptional regulator [Legionellales bacterium]|nr:XRE family transcriptional regulator [Legionellales bacterium]